jgi:alanine racemase
MSTKLVPEGQFIGYGTSYLAGIPTKIATIPVGYAWGFSRNLSNLGRVIVGGKRTAVIGVVNMNMMLADITETPEVKRGDEVVLIGRQNNVEISVASFSELSHRINYETLVRLPAQIPRKLVE